MLLYFSFSLFMSAMLLFLVQPMIGKMILPQLGGTPAVWNTCMVFFQGVLLVGYGYTHLLTTTQPARRQVIIQGVLLFLPFLVLPFSLGEWNPPTDSNPIFALIFKLTLMVGLPFFLVSTTAPLLQKWFIHTDDPAAQDPYFLYGASNFGSMLSLALYPTVVEPFLQVTPLEDESTYRTQVHLWTAGYATFVALVGGCAYVVWKALQRKAAAPSQPTPIAAPTPAPTSALATAVTTSKRRGARLGSDTSAKPSETPAPSEKLPDVTLPNLSDDLTLWRRLRWIGLAAAPSSLMLGVTNYMTTDIAAIASFWIIPLALYLLTFILVFARWPVVWVGTPHNIMMFLQPMVLLLLILKMIANVTLPPKWGMWETPLAFALNLGAFMATTLMCHGELAKDRPSTKHLTEFFFFMSLGGVLGGLFNSFFAPVFFQYGLWEYPAAMAFACVLRSNLVDQPMTLIPGDSSAEKTTKLGISLDYFIPILMGIAAYLAIYVGDHYVSQYSLLRRSYLIAVLVIITLALSLRPVRFGLSIAALFIGSFAYDRVYDSFVYEGRGFFGLMRVREDKGAWSKLPQLKEDHEVPYEWKKYRTLIHGGINHGRQIVGYKDNRAIWALQPANNVAVMAMPFGGPFQAVSYWLVERSMPDFESDAMTRKKRREPITYFHERNGIAELYYKLSWPTAQPLTEEYNMTGASDGRMAASMVGLGAGDFAITAILANTQSEPPLAVLGLGTGILACYAKPLQHVDIFEIDPLVKDLSVPKGYIPPWHEDRQKRDQDGNLVKYMVPDPVFYFVQDATERWAKVDIKLGDGRLVMKNLKDKKGLPYYEKYYHVIALDAFSSDAIPVHLLTRDAVKLYLDKLADGGVLIFNTTNRYVRIEGVLSAIAQDLDLECLVCPDYTYNFDHPDRFSADWLVMRRKGEHGNGGPPLAQRLESERPWKAWTGVVVPPPEGKGAKELRWQSIDPMPGPVWTDGYSNMLNPSVMPWIRPWRR